MKESTEESEESEASEAAHSAHTEESTGVMDHGGSHLCAGHWRACSDELTQALEDSAAQ